VWALVIGGLFGTTLKSILSYLLPKSHPHRWLLEPEARTAIFAAGKWILLSSAVGFISSQADRLIMGKVAGVVDLGIYSVAVLMSGAIAGVVIQITHGVAFPALSMVKNEGIERLRSVYYKVRFGLDLAAMPALGVLCATGHVVIELLYDSRYHQAGWMLQVLVIRSAMTVMVGPCETCLFSMGRTEFAFWQGVVRAVWMAITVPLAFYWMGFSGLVWATAFSELPVMVLLWIPFHKEGMLRWLHEVRSVALLVGGYLIGLPLESIARRILL
jgi:O-antigen/teichoic acid export membrane protein